MISYEIVWNELCCGMVWYGMLVLYGMILYVGMALCGMVFYGMV